MAQGIRAPRRPADGITKRAMARHTPRQTGFGTPA